MTKKQANVIIGLLVVAIFGAFILHVQSEEHMARITNDNSRCWTSQCTIDLAMAAAERLERSY